MRTRLTYLCLYLLSSIPLYSQNWKLIHTVEEVSVESCEFNDRGDVLILQRAGVLSKYSNEGQLLQEFTPPAGMSIDKLQVISVFKNLLFYQSQQKAIILDQYLSSSVQFDLDQYNVRYIDDLVIDSQQKMWFLDGSNFALHQLDVATGETLLTKFLSTEDFVPSENKMQLYSHQNRIYVKDAEHSVMVFDNLGDFIKKIPLVGFKHFRISQDHYYYRLNDHLVFRHLYNESTYELPIPPGEFENIYFRNKTLIGVVDRGFEIYQYLRDE